MTAPRLRTLVAALLAAGLCGCHEQYVEPLPKSAVKLRARTSDGWELALVHYPARGERTGRPVVLCHGISANDRNMDLDEAHSLARWFARKGRDAYSVALRGTGESDRVDLAKGRRGGYSFDAFWRHDLPALIALARAHSGADAVDFVGHSMGGMVAYAYLSQGGQGINAAVTLGSPTRLDWGSALEPYVEQLASLFIPPEAAVPTLLLARLAMPLHGEIPGNPNELLLYNPQNVSKLTWKRLMAGGTADIDGALVHQFARLFKTGAFHSYDRKLDFRRDMASIRTPVLVVAGRLDRMAPVPAVKDGYRALGGPKKWLLVAESHGFPTDYGHMELVIGERAATEVWPHVLSFLDAHRQAAPRLDARPVD